VGTWGIGIFSDDIALDVRHAFRELIAAGRSPEEATDEIVAGWEMTEPTDAYGCAGWLALAVTQWKMGHVVDRVRDTALRAIEVELAEPVFEGADRRKREALLAKTREQLDRPPPAPKRVRAERYAQTPFSPGDVLRYTTASGRQVALWAMFNHEHQDVAHVSVNTCFRVQAIGDPELPPIAEIVRRPPLVITSDDGHRSIKQLFLHHPQDAVGPAWHVIANVPFPSDDAEGRGFTVLTVKPRRPPTLDDTFDMWFARSRAVDPLARALQPLIDAMRATSPADEAWTGHASAMAEDIARDLAIALHEGSDTRSGPVLTLVERYLARDDPAQRRIAIIVLDGLVNAATHREVTFDRDALLERLGPSSQAMVQRLDDVWGAVPTTTSRPPDLLPRPEGDSLAALLWSDELRWAARLRNRDLGDGVYAVTMSGFQGTEPGSGVPRVNHASPSTSID
jgi:hypothetical protein